MTVDPARRETSETAPVVADAATTEGAARGSALWPYWIVRNLAVGFSRLYFRVSYEGLDFVPKTGAFILAPVHRSNVDTLVVAGVTKRRMRFLGKRLEIAEVVDPVRQTSRGQVFFGATVTYVNARDEERTVTILGVDEADITRGEVSLHSPIALVLLRKRVGEAVAMRTPAGMDEIEILAISYPEA